MSENREAENKEGEGTNIEEVKGFLPKRPQAVATPFPSILELVKRWTVKSPAPPKHASPKTIKTISKKSATPKKIKRKLGRQPVRAKIAKKVWLKKRDLGSQPKAPKPVCPTPDNSGDLSSPGPSTSIDLEREVQRMINKNVEVYDNIAMIIDEEINNSKLNSLSPST